MIAFQDMSYKLILNNHKLISPLERLHDLKAHFSLIRREL